MKRPVEPRPCAYRKCGKPFTDQRRFIFCSAKCGRNARGFDARGQRIRVAHLLRRGA